MKLVLYETKYEADFLSLKVQKESEKFIESQKDTLKAYHEMAYDIAWKIYLFQLENEFVGYLMVGLNSMGDLFLDRFLMDYRYEKKGYGRLFFKLFKDTISSDYPGVADLFLSVNVKNERAIRFYEQQGFVKTNYLDGNDPIYQFKIKKCV